jgi:hypothetical protein
LRFSQQFWWRYNSSRVLCHVDCFSCPHDYKTRNRLDFQTQFCRTNIFKKSVNNLGTKLYHKLPNYLKNSENSKLFKKQLKAFFITTDLSFIWWIFILRAGTLKGNCIEEYGINKLLIISSLVWFGLIYSCSVDLQQALTSAVRYRTSQMVEVNQCMLTCFTIN